MGWGGPLSRGQDASKVDIPVSGLPGWKPAGDKAQGSGRSGQTLYAKGRDLDGIPGGGADRMAMAMAMCSGPHPFLGSGGEGGLGELLPQEAAPFPHSTAPPNPGCGAGLGAACSAIWRPPLSLRPHWAYGGSWLSPSLCLSSRGRRSLRRPKRSCWRRATSCGRGRASWSCSR